jgi:hypothetical protein
MPDHGLQSLQQVVLHYRAERRDGSEKKLRWFAIQPTLEETLRKAGRAEGPRGRRLKHQRRVHAAALAELEQLLVTLQDQIRTQPDFEQLHALLYKEVSRIPGIGELTLYDTALRIGAKLGLRPQVVFLHAGTRDGAKALGLRAKVSTLPVSDLPGALAELEAREAGDVLCIYKDDLARLARAV